MPLSDRIDQRAGSVARRDRRPLPGCPRRPGVERRSRFESRPRRPRARQPERTTRRAFARSAFRHPRQMRPHPGFCGRPPRDASVAGERVRSWSLAHSPPLGTRLRPDEIAPVQQGRRSRVRQCAARRRQGRAAMFRLARGPSCRRPPGASRGPIERTSCPTAPSSAGVARRWRSLEAPDAGLRQPQSQRSRRQDFGLAPGRRPRRSEPRRRSGQ